MSRSPLALLRANLGVFLVAVAAGAVVTLGVRSMLVDAAADGHAGHGSPEAPPEEHHAESGHEGHAPEAPRSDGSSADPHAGHPGDGASTPAVDSAGSSSETGALLSLGNADCPVMGAPAKDAVYTDWNGLRVQHCCPGCTETFLEDPETLLDDVNPGWRDALEMARAIDAARGAERDRLLAEAAKRWKVLRRPAGER